MLLSLEILMIEQLSVRMVMRDVTAGKRHTFIHLRTPTVFVRMYAQRMLDFTG